MNEIGVRAGPIHFLRARTRSLLDAATVAKKTNFPHAHADKGPAGNSLRKAQPIISTAISFVSSSVVLKQQKPLRLMTAKF